MPANDQQEAAEGPKKIGATDGLCLLRSGKDIFGSRRIRPQYYIVPSKHEAHATLCQCAEAPAVGSMLDAVDTDELYVHWPRQHAPGLEDVLARLHGAGFETDRTWPTLPLPGSAPGDRTVVRMSRPATTEAATFERSYAAERQLHTPSAEHHALLASLQSEIEVIISDVVRDTGFDKKYGVLDVMHVGSTSRGTYVSFPADFDIVINTARERTLIAPTDAQMVCDTIVDNVVRTDAFNRFVEAIRETSGGPVTTDVRVERKSFGVRGPQSLVARYHLAPADPLATGHSLGFLDVSFGKLPQLIGYEKSIRRLFTDLEPPLAKRLRSEIRLAKSLLGRVGGIYGTSDRGLRAHAVEQWVIQSFNYRASGLAVGTLENALRLIVEEGYGGESNRRRAALPFEDFKTRFPLRHLGWWEIEDAHSDRRLVNLWDLLGDGDIALATPKWEKLVALAATFHRLKAHDTAWSINSFF